MKIHEVDDIFPLYGVQESLLFHYLMDPYSKSYHAMIYIELDGDLNEKCAEQAFFLTVRNNFALRSVFHWNNIGKAVQVVKKNATHLFIKRVNDCVENTDEWFATEAEKIWLHNINIENAPYIFCLLISPPRRSAIIIKHHHILYDGWSNAIFINEFWENYRIVLNTTNGRDVNTVSEHAFLSTGNTCSADKRSLIKDIPQKLASESYDDIFSQKQYKIKSNETYKKLLINKKTKSIESSISYWQDYFSKYTWLSEKHTYNLEKNSYIKHSLHVNNELAQEVIALARRTNASIVNIWSALISYVMQNVLSCDDIVMGLVNSGRDVPIRGIDSIIAMCVHTIPLLVKKIASNSDIIDVINKIRDDMINVIDYPIQSEHDIAKLFKRRTLFEFVINMLNYPVNEVNKITDCLNVNKWYSHEETSYPVCFFIKEANGFEVFLQYEESALTTDQVKQIDMYFNELRKMLV